MTVQQTKPEHEVAFEDIVNLVRKHAETLSPLELLAIAGNMVGKLLAFQDQRKTTPDQAMRTVAKNIEIGNAQAIAKLQNTRGIA